MSAPITATRHRITIKLIDFGTAFPRMFCRTYSTRFFSTKESNKSLGLGLSAVYGIVQRHGGTINVESSVGKGTEFTINLPRVQKLSPIDKNIRQERNA